MSSPATPGYWTDGDLPANVTLGVDSIISGQQAFKRFRSRRQPALVVGTHSTLDGLHFAVGEDGVVSIGDYCCLSNVVLLCEQAVRIGHYVVIGWNTTLADTDFHPLDPALRVADAVACSPLSAGHARPPVGADPITIEDDVYIGPACAILKGVRVGTGAFIEPGSIVTRDVPPFARVMGNPAAVVGDTRR